MALTDSFYDADSGELIEIKDGVVTNVHKSILSKQERLTINRKRAQRLVTQQSSSHNEEPLVQLEMFPSDKPVSNSNPHVAPEMTWNKPKPDYSGHGNLIPNQQEEPLVAPVMTWD